MAITINVKNSIIEMEICWPTLFVADTFKFDFNSWNFQSNFSTTRFFQDLVLHKYSLFFVLILSQLNFYGTGAEGKTRLAKCQFLHG